MSEDAADLDPVTDPVHAWTALFQRSEVNRRRARRAMFFSMLAVALFVGLFSGGLVYVLKDSNADSRFEGLQRQLVCESVLNSDFQRTITRWVNVPLADDPMAERMAVVEDMQKLDRQQTRIDCTKGTIPDRLVPTPVTSTSTPGR